MTAYNSQHALGVTRRRRTQARGCSWAVGMAVFADLDLRAGSDLKALRGLVETAAHREFAGLALRALSPRCHPHRPVCLVVFPGAIPVSRRLCLISLEAGESCGVARIPGVGTSEAPEEAGVAWACPVFHAQGESRGQRGREIGIG